MKRTLLRISNRLHKNSEPFLPPHKIRSFLMDAFSRTNKFSELSDPIINERIQLSSCLTDLGWIHENETEKPVAGAGSPDSYNIARIWFEDKQDQKVIQKKIVSAGCGRYLTILDSAGQMELVTRNMEDLLRHVEIHRRNCLRFFSPAIPEEQRWMERLEICILFSRYARGHYDLRFLNAALKMNDYWFSGLKKTYNLLIFTRYCVSLAQQELSVKELLQ